MSFDETAELFESWRSCYLFFEWTVRIYFNKFSKIKAAAVEKILFALGLNIL